MCLFELFFVDDVRIVEISRSNDGMGSQSQHRLEPLRVPVVLHEPAGRLGTEPNTAAEDEGRDEGRAKLETPGDSRDVLDNDVGAEAQEYTCGGLLADISTLALIGECSLPATTQSCQNMTRAPRMRAGAISAL